MSDALHHFDKPPDAATDTMLKLCIQQGWVPPGCLLGGMMVAGLMQRGEDPCAQCRGPRHQCGGRPYVGEGTAAQTSAQGQGLGLGTSLAVPRDGSFRFFFLGVDPAPSESYSSDDGALVGACATPRVLPEIRTERGQPLDVELSDNEADWWFDYIYARRLTCVERASASQWSGVIHQLHQWFGFEKILMDPSGGGLYVQRDLKQPKQFIDGADRTVTPIADQVTGPTEVTKAYFILHLYKRGDPGLELLWPDLAGDDLLNDSAYSEMKQALDHTVVHFPPKLADLQHDHPEELKLWLPERRLVLVTLNDCVEQFKNIAVATEEGDPTKFKFTRRNARQFASMGKKDLMSAAMYCYLAFRIWLRAEDWRSSLKPENQGMFSMSR